LEDKQVKILNLNDPISTIIASSRKFPSSRAKSNQNHFIDPIDLVRLGLTRFSDFASTDFPQLLWTNNCHQFICNIYPFIFLLFTIDLTLSYDERKDLVACSSCMIVPKKDLEDRKI